MDSIHRQNFKTLRILSGLSKAELAERTNTTRQTINSIEKGTTKRVSASLMLATKLVMEEIIASDDSHSFATSLLAISIDILLDGKYVSGRNLMRGELVFISQAFCAVAVIIEHRIYSGEQLVNTSEAIFRATLEGGLIEEGVGDIYHKIGLPEFFEKYREEAQLRTRAIFEAADRAFREEG